MVRTSERVSSQTGEQINQEIGRQIEMNVAYYTAHPDQIEQRLGELDQEWDIERTLQANAAGIILGSIVMRAIGSRLWGVVPLMVSSFLLQHAIQGWCPPLPLFRRMGVRTVQEIEMERQALKLIRGDYRGLTEGEQARADQLVEAVSR